jgi:hypothetical protein
MNIQYTDEVQKACTNGVTFSFPERKQLKQEMRLEFEDEVQEHEVPAASKDTEKDWDGSDKHDPSKAAEREREQKSKEEQMGRIQRLIAKERERIQDMLNKMMDFFKDHNITYLALKSDGYSYDYSPDDMGLQNTDFYKKDERKCNFTTSSEAIGAMVGANERGKDISAGERSNGKKRLTSEPPSCQTAEPTPTSTGCDSILPTQRDVTTADNGADCSSDERDELGGIADQPPFDAVTGAPLEAFDSLPEKKRKKSKEMVSAFFEYEAICDSDSNEDDFLATDDETYDLTDLHFGRANDPQPPFNQESHGDRDWIEWMPLARTKEMMFKHVARVVNGQGEQAFVSLKSSSIKRLSVYIQSMDLSLDRPRERIKINDFYLKDDVGNTLAQDILDTLGAQFEVVAPPSAPEEAPYEFIGCMKKIKMSNTIKKWENEIEHMKYLHRRAVSLPQKVAARKRLLEAEISVLQSLAYKYEVSL